MDDAQLVLTQYEDIVADLHEQVSRVRGSLPTWLGWLRLGGTIALVWLGITQIGLISQGLVKRRTDRISLACS